MNNSLARGSKLDFVREQLRRYSGAKKELSDSTFVCCPFHSEKTPSFRIFHGEATKYPGYGKCYGCGERAKWDDLAPKLGLTPFQAPKPKDEYARPIKLVVADESDNPVPDDSTGELRLLGALPRGKVWRGFSTKFLSSLGAQLCNVYYAETNYTTENYIYFPVMVRKKLRGYIRARLRKKKDKPSYLNSPGKWSLHYGLFPLDTAIELMLRTTRNVLVLVEGPRDALRLISLGIPAVAILGTHSWSPTKTKMLELSGVDTVVLMFDGDEAGRKATTLVAKEVGLHLNVKRFLLPLGEDLDPGNVPLEYITKLKRRLKIE